MPKVAIIGSGMGSLSAAALLAKAGWQVQIFEQNILPGGCASSYYRQGAVYESGATTLVGLDADMPLKYLLDQLDIKLDAIELDCPMTVHLSDGQAITRHKDLEAWIVEAERVFGGRQREFWTYCKRVADFVWATALRQKRFPPSSWSDLWDMLRNFRPRQLFYARLAFKTVAQLLEEFDLHKNMLFREFITQQLLITAQNSSEETNILFGATALCYTNYGNYYLFGGMLQLARKLVDYVTSKGGEILYRQRVVEVRKQIRGYQIATDKTELQKAQNSEKTEKTEFQSDFVLFGIPLNNVLRIFEPQLKTQPPWLQKLSKKMLPSNKLHSAFQLSIHFKRNPTRQYLPSLHQQIHCAPLPIIGSRSIFVSASHPEDWARAALGEGVLSVSTHIQDPARFIENFDKASVEAAILEILVQKQIIDYEDIIYKHNSGPASWARWTGRQWGFVGGYPQYKNCPPWRMQDARLDGRGAFICGDTAYPGQGIPGVCLSGILAAEKLMHFASKG